MAYVILPLLSSRHANTLVSRSFKTVDVTRLVSFTEVRCRRIGSPVLYNCLIAIISAFVAENYELVVSSLVFVHSVARRSQN